MTRLTMTIPASTAPAVNAALAAITPDATDTFHVHPVVDANGTEDTSLFVASWDVGATGHEEVKAVIAKVVEDNGKATVNKVAKTADIKVGDEPKLAVKVASSDLTVSK